MGQFEFDVSSCNLGMSLARLVESLIASAPKARNVTAWGSAPGERL